MKYFVFPLIHYYLFLSMFAGLFKTTVVVITSPLSCSQRFGSAATIRESQERGKKKMFYLVSLSPFFFFDSLKSRFRTRKNISRLGAFRVFFYVLFRVQ